MKFVMLNGALNGHNVALADGLYEILGDDFVFIEHATKPSQQYGSYVGGRKGVDYHKGRAYVFNMHSCPENEQRAIELINTADVVRTAGEPFDLIKDRVKQGKLTFHASERFFKNGFLCIKPSSLLFLVKKFRIYSGAHYRVLCQSAFLPNDMRVFGGYKEKCYKFAYFPQIPLLNIDTTISNKPQDILSIMWCARFIDLKHPEMMVTLAENMLASGRKSFQIKMVGADTTPVWRKIKEYIEKKRLQEYVILTGGVPNSEVRSMMRNSNVFAFTSDKGEGWGVVLSEAMGSGCACIGSSEIGSVPFLLKHKRNGLIFKSRSNKSLFENVAYLYDNRDKCEEFGRAAYHTITEDWSGKVGAERLVQLSESILAGNEMLFKGGLCSKAYPVNPQTLIR